MSDNKKSGFVTLVGRPNVGKSTLMNHLIGQKIAITSDKPQTTRNRIQTVYTDERGQIIFLDTPGIHKAKNKLGEYMVDVAEHTLKEVDVILWLVEPTTFIGAGERHIAEQLSKVKTPVILVINKIDTLKMIGAFSELDAPLNPSAKGARNLGAWLSGITDEMVQKERDQILDVTQEDIRALAEQLEAALQTGALCAIGNEQQIMNEKELFGEVKNLYH